MRSIQCLIQLSWRLIQHAWVLRTTATPFWNNDSALSEPLPLCAPLYNRRWKAFAFCPFALWTWEKFCLSDSDKTAESDQQFIKQEQRHWNTSHEYMMSLPALRSLHLLMHLADTFIKSELHCIQWYLAFWNDVQNAETYIEFNVNISGQPI